MFIILLLNAHLKSIITELSVFALLTALTTKYNFIFLIPFYPALEFFPINVVTFVATLISCNCQWKVYMQIFSMLAVHLEQPEIINWVIIGNALFFAVTVFKKWIF
jgi:hypothetical protein